MHEADKKLNRTYHHGDLKQALLDETARILREEGEEALSLRRLATNLGVSRTAPYNHYKKKEGLLCAVAEEGFRRFSHEMDKVEKSNNYRDGRSMMRAYVSAYISFARDNPEYYDLMYGRSSWQSEEHTQSLSDTARSTLRDFVERLKQRQQQKQIRQDVDVVQFAQLYWGTLHGISRLLLDGVYTKSASVQKLCAGAADMLWQQLDPAA
ncbi:MAG: TetR/AcrR family transcriptional regulator [Halieaceae bacterium]|nr:TetR/AcrR family transcriptional regulator [Halieaceae bacterium]